LTFYNFNSFNLARHFGTMRLRVRGPSGTANITIADSATWGELKHEISAQTSVADFDIKYGYPPKTLDATEFSDSTALSDLGINLNGEQLTIAPNQSTTGNSLSGSAPDPSTVKSLPPLSKTNPPSHQADDFPSDPPLSLTRKQNPTLESDPPEIPVPALEGVLVLRVMPDDNSCLFRALGSAVLGSSVDSMTELRSIVAQTIQSNPELYSAGVLEKNPDEYCRWIQREDSWGGGIELAILSQHFDIEVASINVQDLRIDRFNEGKATRCILVYSGIHYDVVAVTPVPGVGPEFDRKVFEVARLSEGEEEDGGALEGARELCRALQQRHYFTDTKGFEIKCNVCGWMGKGEKGATEHAKQTGHMDFGEAA